MGDITTPARRMARAVNALENAPRTWVLAFDNDGYETSRCELQSISDCPRNAHEHAAGQGRRVTGRDMQDDLDREAGLGDFLATATPDEIREAGYEV